MSDDESFLVGICRNPDDDVPRLVYADWLEERGQAERAEFIRVQIELANLGVNPDGSVTTGDKESDEREIEIRKRIKWLLKDWDYGRGWRNLASREVTRIVKDGQRWHHAFAFYRGLVNHIACRLTDFIGPKCVNCENGTQRHMDIEGYIRDRQCYYCNGTGTIPGLAITLFKVNPITEVVLTNREPDYGGSWISTASPDAGLADYRSHSLPREIFDLLEGYEDSYHGEWVRYSSREDALQAKSLACVNYARSLHGYAPLVRTNRSGK